MELTKPAPHLVAEASNENVPVERYIQAYLEKQKSQYFSKELKKVLIILIENIHDKDTFEKTFDIVIEKFKNVIKHEVKSEIIKENWRVS